MSPYPDGANVNVLDYIFAYNSVIGRFLSRKSVGKKASSRENLFTGITVLYLQETGPVQGVRLGRILATKMVKHAHAVMWLRPPRVVISGQVAANWW